MIPRLANRRSIAFCMVQVTLCATITADVESGKINRQNRDDSAVAVNEYSYSKITNKE